MTGATQFGGEQFSKSLANVGHEVLFTVLVQKHMELSFSTVLCEKRRDVFPFLFNDKSYHY